MGLSAVRIVALTFIISLLSPLTPAVEAAELDGVTLPDSIDIEGQTLVLNGLGTRKATIFGFHVYVAGLYLPEKKSDAEEILNSPVRKFLLMEVVRTVSREDIVDAWETGLKKNVDNPEPFTLQLNAVTSPMADVKPGEHVSVIFDVDSVQLETPGKRKFRVNGEGFGKALLSIWLGKNPPNRALKRGLLGQE